MLNEIDITHKIRKPRNIELPLNICISYPQHRDKKSAPPHSAFQDKDLLTPTLALWQTVIMHCFISVHALSPWIFKMEHLQQEDMRMLPLQNTDGYGAIVGHGIQDLKEEKGN